MSHLTRPSPPTDRGWYCVNLRTDMENREPGQLICAPQMVWFDPFNFPEHVAYDPLSPCRGGVEGVEEVEIWGDRVEGLDQRRLDL